MPGPAARPDPFAIVQHPPGNGIPPLDDDHLSALPALRGGGGGGGGGGGQAQDAAGLKDAHSSRRSTVQRASLLADQVLPYPPPAMPQ